MNFIQDMEWDRASEAADEQRTVWKCVLRVGARHALSLPEGAEVVAVAEQGGTPCMWFDCDPRSATERRDFCVVGTGWTAPPKAPPTRAEHVGTAVMRDGHVWHVFEVFDHLEKGRESRDA
ncbi:MAG: DUF7352 domain-containing protein [Gemmatimonadota bacterium]